MKKYISNQSGRSMIEMLGVLAIVGVLSVAGIAGYSKAMAKYKTNKLIDQVSTVAANVRTAFTGQGNYKGLNTENAYNLGLFSDEMVRDCEKNGFILEDDAWGEPCLRNVFGRSIAVKVSKDNNSSFDIGFSGVTKDACAILLTTDWGSASGFLGIIETIPGDGVSDIEKYAISDGFLIPSATIAERMSFISRVCDCPYADCMLAFRFK